MEPALTLLKWAHQYDLAMELIIVAVVMVAAAAIVTFLLSSFV
jgi:hypothetical protein